jgi:hypothetical protein
VISQQDLENITNISQTGEDAERMFLLNRIDVRDTMSQTLIRVRTMVCFVLSEYKTQEEK